MKPMSDYYLADLKGRGTRAATPKRELEPTREPKKSQDMKVTLLGDFLFPTTEPQGCDPYNSTQWQSPRAKPGGPGAIAAEADARTACVRLLLRSCAGCDRAPRETRCRDSSSGKVVSPGKLRADRVQQRQIFDAGAQIGVR